ncbi:MAG: HNH endonuclease, partial [Verrucomicrobiota bacterium]
VCSCIECNRRKANRTPEEANMRLLREPQKPPWRPFLEITFTHKPHQSWRHFLDLSQWDVKLG